jgi:transposase
MIGARRHDRWLTLSTAWKAVNAERFVAWGRRTLAPRLRRGDIVVLDNLRAHKDRRIKALIAARGARVRYLPPYSRDFNPIEPGWGLIKKHMRKVAPRSGPALRRTAQHARYTVKPRHCQQWFTHAGYRRSK